MIPQRHNPLQQIPERNDPMQGKITRRERQILDLIGRGKTTKEIALILNLSTLTIGNHRKIICRKWNIHSTAELVYRAGLRTHENEKD